ncbi:MAG: hypothetical protein HYY24_03285 [Verrucomicrobia bacterium]|nr:hypothetical protein [Verrucomicrobiota bacterium]
MAVLKGKPFVKDRPHRIGRAQFMNDMLLFGRAVVRSRTILLALCLTQRAGAAPADTVVVASPARANPAQRLAVEELASCLGRIYPQTRFVTAGKLPASGNAILVGSDASVRSMITDADLSRPESYAVRSVRRGNQQLGLIAGADTRGAMHGVYALLEKLGCGFFLSGDALPPARTEPFSFDGWALSSAPLVRDRLVFNWHNFLSGCSTWNLPEWNSWTAQSLKQGYNGIMVHAYGNNPMVSFSFNGKTKPVGFLSTTVKGRDWSTMHINDVRRLFGGEVFNTPVFGAAAAQVPDARRAAAARKLMRGVFAHAQQRGMDVYFATDVDTVSANPQELIRTLPEDARFPIQTQAVGWMGQEADKLWLANPDTSEGHRYYRAQVAALLKAYPQITCLVVWFRQGGTPWMEVKLAELPPCWQEEWRAEIARTPAAEKLWHAPQVFALGKIVRAFDRALKELGRERVQLAAGTWDFKFLAPCHRFFPPHVKLIGLDYNALHGRPQLGDDASRQVIRDVAAQRPVLPVIWAHHDDGNYIGRPYTPFAGFATKLADARAGGFGVIHWMTRPLDLYFKSHAEQVWIATKDRPLRATCDEMAARLFGAAARTAMGEYLERWVSDAPNFARETSDYFIDRPLTNVMQVVTDCRERLKLIESVDAQTQTPDQCRRLDYFKGLEEFIVAFFQTQAQFQQAQAALNEGDLATAHAAMAICRPEPVIEQFAKSSALGGITRGEQGLVVSLNTRWLSHYVRLRQQLGLAPVRYAFAPTSHDPLAQSAGKFTFHFDREHALWECLGEKETSARVFVVPARAKIRRAAALPAVYEEICRAGVESEKPLRFALQPIMARDSREKSKPVPLPAGDYRLRLLAADPTSTAARQRVFDLKVTTGAAGAITTRTDRVDIFARAGGAHRVLELVYPVKLTASGAVEVELAPVAGSALICGAVLEPVR